MSFNLLLSTWGNHCNDIIKFLSYKQFLDFATTNKRLLSDMQYYFKTKTKEMEDICKYDKKNGINYLLLNDSIINNCLLEIIMERRIGEYCTIIVKPVCQRWFCEYNSRLYGWVLSCPPCKGKFLDNIDVTTINGQFRPFPMCISLKSSKKPISIISRVIPMR